MSKPYLYGFNDSDAAVNSIPADSEVWIFDNFGIKGKRDTDTFTITFTAAGDNPLGSDTSIDVGTGTPRVAAVPEINNGQVPANGGFIYVGDVVDDSSLQSGEAAMSIQ